MGFLDFWAGEFFSFEMMEWIEFVTVCTVRR